MAQYNVDQIVYIRSNNTSDTYNLIDSDARDSISNLSSQLTTMQTELDAIVETFPPSGASAAQVSGSSNNNNLLYLTGAEIQDITAQTYSNKNAYTQNGVLFSMSSIAGNNIIIEPEQQEEQEQEQEEQEENTEYYSSPVLTWLDTATALSNSNNKIPTLNAVQSYIQNEISQINNWQNGTTINSIRMTSSTAEDTDPQSENPYVLGEAALAEGKNTKAVGDQSHVQGLGTIANYASQHVFGEYNIPDSIQNGSSNSKGNYIEIVGNGTGSNIQNRSNARTLDWNGNEILAGKLTLGAEGETQYDAPNIQQVENSLQGEIININNSTGIGTLNIFLQILAPEEQ